MSKEYDAYLEKQASIYGGGFAEAKVKMLAHTAGVERDVAGTDPQGAFLVAWRYPESTTSLLKEFSLEAASLIDAVTYDETNGHTTLSDFGLEKGKVIRPKEDAEHAEILDTLAKAVKNGLDLSGSNIINGCSVEFTDLLTNGKTIVAAGIPTESVYQINQQVLSESTARGVELKGTWGSHMTTNRFLEDEPAGSPAITALMDLIENTPDFGNATPTSIDVGYFQTDPQNGFVFTPVESFPIARQ